MGIASVGCEIALEFTEKLPPVGFGGPRGIGEIALRTSAVCSFVVWLTSDRLLSSIELYGFKRLFSTLS